MSELELLTIVTELLDKRPAMIRELYKAGVEILECGGDTDLLLEIEQTLLILESLDE